MQRPYSIPVIAVAGLFWLVAETPAKETGYNIPFPNMTNEIESIGHPGSNGLRADLQFGMWDPPDFAPNYSPAPLLMLSAFNQFRGVNESSLLAGQAGLLRTLNDDDGDVFKRLTRRPEVRRKDRRTRTGWPDWLLGWCLDLVAILAAAEISATIIARAL